ncbi:MAG TPA: GAF domain-containing protein [Capillimicrobium sp.]|nr:GAF domain-containing protein [Capillimicrobium sp.]
MAPPTRSDPHVAALDVFTEVLSQSDTGETPDAFYSRLCEAVCGLARMERAVLFRYDGALRRVRAAGAHGVPLALFANERFTVESAAIARQALEEDRVIEAWSDVDRLLPARYVDLLAPSHVVCTPMAAAGRWVGVILADRRPEAPRLDDADRDLLWTLGKTAALAAVARIATSQRERAVQLEHRLDLAREVHDGVIQRLFGVSLALSGDRELSPEARRRCAEEVQGALADLRATLQRPLSRAPRPSATTLGDELERLAREHPDLGVRLEEGDPAGVPPALEPLAQSVLAEAVRNAHKHADPTRVAVRLRRADGAFVLEVENDGAHGRRRTTGMGLRLAAFEALQSGGVVEYGRGERDTWRVKLVVPEDDG